MSVTASGRLVRELDQRSSDGITIMLWWDPALDGVGLDITDERIHEQWMVRVPADEALNAFHHPFAYLASEKHIWSLTDEIAEAEQWLR
jgi:hypothetical protein